MLDLRIEGESLFFPRGGCFSDTSYARHRLRCLIRNRFIFGDSVSSFCYAYFVALRNMQNKLY